MAIIRAIARVVCCWGSNNMEWLWYTNLGLYYIIPDGCFRH